MNSPCHRTTLVRLRSRVQLASLALLLGLIVPLPTSQGSDSLCEGPPASAECVRSSQVPKTAEKRPSKPKKRDTPRQPKTIGGFPPMGPLLPERRPRPQLGPPGVRNFVQEISTHQSDATIEVVLGRPRLLTLKRNLGQDGQAVIGVGDPSIADFDVLSLRQIRILGLRPGVTDLSITEGGQSYVFRIPVIPDIDELQAKLHAVFPEARLRLTPLREHLIVTGRARDQAQLSQILQLLRSYQASLQAELAR